MKLHLLIVGFIFFNMAYGQRDDACYFDMPFASTSLQNMLALTTPLLDDLTMMQQTMSHYNYSMLHDVIVGRIVRLRYRTQTLLHDYEQGMPLLLADVEYLASMLERINTLYQKIVTDETHVAATMIADIACSIDQMLNP